MSEQNALFGSDGVDALFGVSGNPNEYEIMVNLDDIEIEAQVREEFEDDTNGLAELGRSLRVRQIQAIVIRLNRPGREKPYLLVAGERRYRGAQLEGLTQLRARVMELTDEEAEDAQLAENIHRKNLTQIEEAKKIQRDLDSLGSVEAVLEKHHKSRAWLSKNLALLNLPEQAKRLISEDISADIEVINNVKTIANIDPVAAEALVDNLKATRGKENAREQVSAVKDQVKPPPKKKEGKKPATQVDVFAGAKNTTEGDGEQSLENHPTRESVGLVLSLVYSAIFLQNGKPKSVLDDMSKDDREMIEVWLRAFYDMGVQSKDAGRDALKCLRDEHFAADGVGAFALAAFMYGVAHDTKFSLLNIFGSVKA